MDKHLWLSLLRLVDEGSAEELQAKKEELLQSLERLRITRGPVRSDVLRVVRLVLGDPLEEGHLLGFLEAAETLRVRARLGGDDHDR